MKKRPNVIIILADDMGYGDLSRVNGGLSCTPRLDGLAADSLRLAQGYSASCVCAPARAGLMTGRYPHRTGCTSLNSYHGINRLAPAEVTLGDIFAHYGYHTGLVGKWHLGDTPECHPNRRGFRDFEGFSEGATEYYRWNLDCNGRKEQADGRYLTEVLTEKALYFLRRITSPFFLYLAYYTPHRPLEAPQEILAKYLAREDLTPGQAHVYAMIEVMDTGIGRVLDTLDELGLSEDTIVMFSSDNGPDPVSEGPLSPLRFNCGLTGTKYLVQEGGIRVPFLLRWPAGLEAGVDRQEMFHFVDVLPTLVSACGLDLPGAIALDGENRLPVLRHEAAGFDPVRFWQWNRYHPIPECNAAMRDGNWKLLQPALDGHRAMLAEDTEANRRYRESGVRDFEITPPPVQDLGLPAQPQLYDLSVDPGETRDLAESHPERCSRMGAELNSWFEIVMEDFRTATADRF